MSRSETEPAPETPADGLRDLYREGYVTAYHQEAGPRLERLVERMDLAPDLTVADLACGNGLLLDVVRSRVGRYFGVDFSEEFIEAARQRHAAADRGGAEFSFHAQSIEAFCEAHPGEIDRAFVLDFVEHVYDADLLGTLAAIRGCLRPDGRLYLHTPNRDFFVEALKDRGIMKQLPEHIAVRNDTETVALLERAGFSEVRCEAIAHYLPALSWCHAFSRVPVVGRFMRARLFVEARP